MGAVVGNLRSHTPHIKGHSSGTLTYFLQKSTFHSVPQYDGSIVGQFSGRNIAGKSLNQLLARFIVHPN